MLCPSYEGNTCPLRSKEIVLRLGSGEVVLVLKEDRLQLEDEYILGT